MPIDVKSLYDLRGKSAYIPGGYGGIGAAIAWGLASCGASVVVSGRKKEKADALAAQLKSAGHEACSIAMDANSVAEIRESVDFVAGKYGRVDILVNCVGINIEMPMLEFTEEAYDEVYRVNQKAAMFLGQQVGRHQVKAGRGGKQVHILSVRSQLALRGRGYSAYCSTKAAMALLIKQHAMELAPHKINVNGVAPTFIYTDMVTDMLADANFKNMLLARIPLGRIGNPDDTAGPAVFLCSAASDFMTGQVVFADGGVTACQ
ncbi:MAG TPA: SDR family oxidoreductase [Planctomycetota bacterium]|nr:SDR family oxidoreductase [Planctomycetota bacterium]